MQLLMQVSGAIDFFPKVFVVSAFAGGLSAFAFFVLNEFCGFVLVLELWLKAH